MIENQLENSELREKHKDKSYYRTSKTEYLRILKN